MTDNEIIKALEICIMGDCEICSCRCGSVGDCRDALNKKSLDLINRQQAEIDRLQEDSKRLKKVQMQLDDLCIMHNIIKAEAYKEFAERLKTKASDFEYGKAVWLVYIDNLLKEMVGEDNA